MTPHHENLWTLLATKVDDLVREAKAFQLQDIPAFVDAAVHPESIDDRELLLERALVLMAKLGNSDTSPHLKRIGKQIEELAVDLLYKDLPHPPADYSTYLPEDADYLDKQDQKYAFRSIDGTGYNVLIPGMGRARGPYARSVPALKRNPPHYLPDASLVFDTLMARGDFVSHPGGISSLFFAFANVIIHILFETDHQNYDLNKTSSYLDLSSLYGTSVEVMKTVRRYDGTGRLWNDVWADKRMLLMPPSVSALMIIFNRNHNYVAEKLLHINEDNRYTQDINALDEAKKAEQDEDLFNRARLVNCGFFMQVILGDYVGAILGLVRDGYDWRLDPLMEMRRTNHEVAPRGEGNVVSIEFNLLYRWHAALSQEDTAWTETFFRSKFEKVYPGQDVYKMTIPQFQNLARLTFDDKTPVREWTFSGLERDSEGRFKDKDIAKILQNATKSRAGAFKSRGIPEILKVIEVLGIEQARSWGACSLNEFRKFMGLKTYESFEEWNTDKSVAKAAESLYKHIDNLELHVGMQAEETKTPGPGAGLCPGYTISRAILADAVALTRGDRFLTTDLTPKNLTTWGYQDCQRDIDDGAYGGMLTRLLFRHLPQYYPAGSVYAHFPFLTPDYIYDQFEKTRPELLDKYLWASPDVDSLQVKMVREPENLAHIAKEGRAFEARQRERLASIAGHRLPAHGLITQFFKEDKQLQGVADRMEQITRHLLSSRSHTISSKNPTRYVDIVQDVIHMIPIIWIGEDIAGLPIGHDDGHCESEYFKMFCDVFRYATLTPADVEDAWSLREGSDKAYHDFTHHVKKHLDHLVSWLGSLTDTVTLTNTRCHEFLRKLKHTGSFTLNTHDELADALFCDLVPTIVPFSICIAVCLNKYMQPERAQDKETIISLARGGEADLARLWGEFMLPAIAESPPIASREYRTKEASKSMVGEHSWLGVGDVVVADISGLGRVGQEWALGLDLSGLTSPDFLKYVGGRVLATLLSVKDLKPASKSDTVLSSRFIDINKFGIREVKYINRNGDDVPWPTEAILTFTV